MKVERKSNTVTYSRIDEKYRGLGLGKKLYGDVMKARRAPLRSDTTRTPAAERLWKSLERGSYSVRKFPAGASTGRGVTRKEYYKNQQVGKKPLLVTKLAPHRAGSAGFYEASLPPKALK
jgi:hypothetical protein